MVGSSGGNWESEQLEATFAKRVRSGWGAYWVAGSRQEPPPVPPIALTGGIPDPHTLPTEELIEASNTVLRREGPLALRYGGHQGYPDLREWLAEQASARDGMSLTAENFSLVNGISGAMLNVCETLLDEGDVGLTEAPTFPGGAGCVRHCMADLIGVPLDDDGLIPEALEETIERLEREDRRVKLLYTTPSFQNPTGSALSVERRQAVVDICQRHGVVIAEDNAYGDIRLDGDPLPTLYSIAQGKGVIHMGTFSKTVATGLRVGWLQADLPMIEALLKTRFDLGSSPWLHRTMLEFVRNGSYEPHLKKVNDVYRRKRDAMLAALDERCQRYARWNRPDGGYFLWMTLAESVDPTALADAARRLGVAFVSGRAFHPDGQGQQFVRLAYSFVDEQEIPEAIQRLGRALEEATT